MSRPSGGKPTDGPARRPRRQRHPSRPACEERAPQGGAAERRRGELRAAGLIPESACGERAQQESAAEGRPGRLRAAGLIPESACGERAQQESAAEGRPGRLRAVGLISGGLDSTLAAEMLKRQGVEITGLNFSTGFCKTDHRRAVRRRKGSEPKKLRNEALRAGAEGEFPVEVVDVAEEYLREVVLNPEHGYGSQVNPCIDCRIFMLRKAREYADASGAEIVFTGEVIGQRPFSQYREALRVIEQKSGLAGRLLRPLSAKHLPPTRAETEGRIERESLGRLGGRSRRAQEALARAWGITDFPQPSGGCCYLADETYTRRFRDLLAHGGAGALTREAVVLLKVGRQFRLSPQAKLHLGREEAENAFLHRFAAGRWTAEAAGVEGPTGVIQGAPEEADLALAARIVARYADLEGRESVEVIFVLRARDSESVLESGTGCSDEPTVIERRCLRVRPAAPAEVEPYRL